MVTVCFSIMTAVITNNNNIVVIVDALTYEHRGTRWTISKSRACLVLQVVNVPSVRCSEGDQSPSSLQKMPVFLHVTYVSSLRTVLLTLLGCCHLCSCHLLTSSLAKRWCKGGGPVRASFQTSETKDGLVFRLTDATFTAQRMGKLWKMTVKDDAPKTQLWSQFFWCFCVCGFSYLGVRFAGNSFDRKSVEVPLFWLPIRRWAVRISSEKERIQQEIGR